MKRRTLLSLLLTAACARGARSGKDSWRSWAQPGYEFGELTLAEIESCERELARFARMFESVRPDQPPLARLSQLIFHELSFTREVDEKALEFLLLPRVLKARRGNCVGLGTVYLALANLLEIPLAGVLRPGHFFVRSGQQGAHLNAELLRQGESLPDSWYEARFPIPGRGSRAYDRCLTPNEVRGVIEYDIGVARREQSRLPEARRAFLLATEHFPEFGEAHASLGSVYHLLGELESAERAYLAARRATMDLPGLDLNLQLLRSERAAP